MPSFLLDWVMPAATALGLLLTTCQGGAEWAWKRFGNTSDMNTAWLLARVIDGSLPRILGYLIGLAGQPIWLIWTWQQRGQSWGPFIASVFCTWAWCRGLRNARRGKVPGLPL